MDDVLDSTASGLCLPLIKYLQGRPLLDAAAKKTLEETRTEIDNVLSPMPPLSTSLHKVAGGPTANNPVLKKTTVNKQSPRIMDYNADGSDAPHGATINCRAVRSTDRGRLESLRKQRDIVAVRPFIQLTEVESNLTVMEWAFGRTFYEWYWRQKRAIAPLTYLNPLISWISAGMAILLSVDGARATAGLVSAIWSVLIVLTIFGMANQKLLSISIMTFDALLFIGETAMLCLSLIGIFCFSAASCAVGVSGFLAITSLLLYYDSLPSSARKRSYKWILLFWILCWSLLIAIIYFRIPPDTCAYRLDLKHGLIKEDDPRRTRWSFSVMEFFLNRGSTLLILMVRATYLAFRYPQDCVFIKSRMRVIEIQTHGATNG